MTFAVATAETTAETYEIKFLFDSADIAMWRDMEPKFI